MGIGDKYTQFGELKKGVIVPAIDQINEFTDHDVRVSYRKVGRTFRFIRFSFNVKDREKSKAIETTTKPSKRSKTQNRPLSEPFRDPNTLDLFTGSTDNEKQPAWQIKGLTDKQINKIAIYADEFTSANSKLMSPSFKGDYNGISTEFGPYCTLRSFVEYYTIIN
jgi:hypothetical protein